MSFSHWLVDENRGKFLQKPLKNNRSMMIDGIPHYQTGPNVFLPKGRYWSEATCPPLQI